MVRIFSILGASSTRYSVVTDAVSPNSGFVGSVPHRQYDRSNEVRWNSPMKRRRLNNSTIVLFKGVPVSKIR